MRLNYDDDDKVEVQMSPLKIGRASCRERV